MSHRFITLMLCGLLPLGAQAADSGAIIGGAVGGAAGALIGQKVGGKNGAIAGAAIGGAAGVAIGAEPEPRRERVIVERDGDYRRRHHHHHDNGRHRGWHKHED